MKRAKQQPKDGTIVFLSVVFFCNKILRCWILKGPKNVTRLMCVP